MVETLLAKPNPALLGTSGQDSGLDKGNCNSRNRDKRPCKPPARKTGAASPTHELITAKGSEAENGAKTSLHELSHQLAQLAEIMNTFAPVVKELKSAYDAARQQDGADPSNGEIDEYVIEPRSNGSSSGTRESSEAVVDDLVQEATEIESTDKALPEKNFLRLGQYFGFGAKRAGPKQQEGKNQKT